MRDTRILLTALLLAPLAALQADEPREQILTLGKLTAPPALYSAEGFAGEAGVKAVFFEALPWKGKPTRVFAWLGIPGKCAGKLLGIVLVHGGGGTAFKEWVQKWNEHGFAAISIAVEGQIDERDTLLSKGRSERSWKRHGWAGPARSGIYKDSTEPLPEQWMWHAVADAVLANSLLRSLPEVDPDKVGIMGISWGGVITSTVIGIDSRFAFAIPTYGCGHLFDSDNQYGRALGDNELYRQAWDPMVRMNRVHMPGLWLSWPGDQHFPLDCQAATYRAAPGPRMVSLIPGMKHSHEAAWTSPDSYTFAESVVKTGSPWCRKISARLNDAAIRVEFYSTKNLDRAVLVSTADSGFSGNRKWLESPAILEKRGDTWLVSAPLPTDATAWFVNVRSGNLTVSSDYQERTR